MFYEQQELENQENYKKMLSLIGNLTLLFSENNAPYLPYRVHENIFCKYFGAENLARSDCSADAKYNKIGIGLKTWTGNNDQKIAEFGKLRNTYSDLEAELLIKKIAQYRNERIRVTKKIHGLDQMIYHIVKRVPKMMQIIECSFDYIDIEKIRLLPNRGNENNIYFKDSKNTYHFSLSKNTLYMLFENYTIVDEFEVEIMLDPYSYLMNSSEAINLQATITPSATITSDKLCLRLYSSTKEKGNFVPEKSGLNQWNAGGRARNANEIYIPYPAKDRQSSNDFFPPKDVSFDLELPDGSEISAKVCQDDGKAIMSNPNSALGLWLLRDVFELKEKELITYEMLEIFDIDSVIFTKMDTNKYKIDFAPCGTYENFNK